METMKDRVLEELRKQIGTKSVRDREALRIAERELTVFKDGHFYRVCLGDRSVTFYCNKKHLYGCVYDLLLNNQIWTNAKIDIKNKYKKSKY